MAFTRIALGAGSDLCVAQPARERRSRRCASSPRTRCAWPPNGRSSGRPAPRWSSAATSTCARADAPRLRGARARHGLRRPTAPGVARPPARPRARDRRAAGGLAARAARGPRPAASRSGSPTTPRSTRPSAERRCVLAPAPSRRDEIGPHVITPSMRKTATRSEARSEVQSTHEATPAKSTAPAPSSGVRASGPRPRARRAASKSARRLQAPVALSPPAAPTRACRRSASALESQRDASPVSGSRRSSTTPSSAAG